MVIARCLRKEAVSIAYLSDYYALAGVARVNDASVSEFCTLGNREERA